jgi:putative DNA primase/helicase
MEKYSLTTFKNRYQTEGTVIKKTFEEIFLTFKNKAKRTREKYNEYVNADKPTQLTIKDIGGFIGGVTENNRRINGVKIKRKLLTLDIDTKTSGVFDYLERNTFFLCMVHSTHRHSPEENRFRIVAPLSREVNADEYEAIGRRIAYKIENAEHETFKNLFDETTFQANRLMFFPSVSADGEYICSLLNHDFFDENSKIIDVDRVLDEYLDKNDIYEWFAPTKIDNERIGKTLDNKHPLKAKGLVGAFNRTYTISQTIEKFLGDVYTLERNGRYTYNEGDSHGGGIILNDDTIFYSHHGTDPANLYYRNAFDLVRIHKFGKFDESFTPEKIIEKDILEKTESFSKMIEFCRTIPEVLEHSDSNISLTQKIEKQEQYIEKNYEDTKEKEKEEKKPDKSWVVQLDGVTSKLAKLEIIFDHDDKIGNLFYFDTFRDNICFNRKPYWHKDFIEGSAITDKDMAHIRVYLDKVYGIRGEKMIDDGVVVNADKIQKNKVLDFFESLVWDGKERLEFFFNDFFRVPLNPFTRAAFKHWLVGAVARIYRAGSPMDMLLIIKGKQGIGKSLFLKKLATLDFKDQSTHLYSDTKIDFDRSKDSYEQLEGIWIYEWKELAGMNMSEQESIKAFVDKTEDKFRRSYGRRNVEIKRRVVFGGTTNDKTPLRDRTGNRRFLVLESPLNLHECYIKDTKKFSQTYKDQLIAEAIHLYKKGFEWLEWSEEELEWWERSNENNLAENDLIGAIENFLGMDRPHDWYSMSINEMFVYMDNYDFEKGVCDNPVYRDLLLEKPKKTCVQEIWKVALRQRDITINRFHRELIGQAIEKLGWTIEKRQLRFGPFGHQLAITKRSDAKNETPDDSPF